MPHPVKSPSRHIDTIDERLLQLHAVCGLLRALDRSENGAMFYADDIGNLAWLVDELLDDLNRAAQALYKQALAGQEVR